MKFSEFKKNNGEGTDFDLDYVNFYYSNLYLHCD